MDNDLLVFFLPDQLTIWNNEVFKRFFFQSFQSQVLELPLPELQHQYKQYRHEQKTAEENGNDMSPTPYQNLRKLFYLLIRILPVISAGTGRSIMVRMVGARSPSFPGWIFPLQVLSMIKKGTGLSVCAVLGLPSSLIM